ncbi:DUF1674 domain-containing protein [Gellertiella hungarica]|uniref:DUF1674 domain-containing protein n=1 Tax=Gellertiella hungarica TaxID=1572859 RepID=A0A7W6NMP4_9HYPH|nr:DUF1674 domain-containing protein [Gellertiella hungarica]MBB4066834.1 hypothetical protein [Gellertiella hungarica]
MSPAENDNNPPSAVQEQAAEKPKVLSPAAERALREAEARRQAEKEASLPTEYGGRGGADPSRFGDWEINGRAIDF